jgi:tetratricopeptide (TPR) repeat protein
MLKHFLFVVAGMLFVFGADAQVTIDKNAINEYFQNQQFDEVIAALAPALRADSNDARVLGLAGYAYYMNENSRAAYACYRRMIVLDSNNIAALHYLVLIRFGEDADEAIGYAMRLLQLQPARAAWWRIMGELSLRKQQPDTALAEVLTDQKNFARADTILDSALSVDSVNLSLLRLRVRSAYLQQDYPLAILYGERVLRSGERPRERPILEGLGSGAAGWRCPIMT